jgi:hypothetical protein
MVPASRKRQRRRIALSALLCILRNLGNKRIFSLLWSLNRNCDCSLSLFSLNSSMCIRRLLHRVGLVDNRFDTTSLNHLREGKQLFLLFSSKREYHRFVCKLARYDRPRHVGWPSARESGVVNAIPNISRDATKPLKTLEASTGIEPVYTDLQSSASRWFH